MPFTTYYRTVKWDLIFKDPGWHMQRIRFHSFEQLSGAVNGAELSVRQLSAQSISGWATHDNLHGALISAGQTSGHLELTGPLSLDGVTIGVATSLAGSARHFGNASPDSSVLVFPKGEDQHSLYGGGVEYFSFMTSNDDLLTLADREELSIEQAHLAVPLALDAGPALRKRTWAIIKAFGNGSAHPTEDQVFDVLLDVLNTISSGEEEKDARRRYDLIFRRALEVIHSTSPAEISVRAICQAIDIPQKALYRAFLRECGVPPYEFVQHYRLSEARLRILASSGSAHAPVTESAVDCGFHDLGRFAAYYRRSFGELPRDTVEQR
ncbi:MAG: helix-turn-helix domain-containing protein [Hyphomicrobiaceae bacterium]